jgi:hypothetical protein
MPGAVTSLVLIALAQPAGGDEPQPTAGRIVLVVRAGKLAREEVSPVETSPATALWRLALAGVTWTRLALPAPRGEETQSAAFLREMEAARLGGALRERGQRLAAIDLAADVSVEPAGPIRDLHSLFGAPPAASPEETAGIAALRRALGGEDDAATAAAVKPAAKLEERLRTVGDAALALILVQARAADATAVRDRDEELSRIEATTEAAAYVIVVNLPESGDGCLVARGPRLKEGRVFAAPRTARSAAALVALFLGGAPEAELGPEARDEAASLLK